MNSKFRSRYGIRIFTWIEIKSPNLTWEDTGTNNWERVRPGFATRFRFCRVEFTGWLYSDPDPLGIQSGAALVCISDRWVAVFLPAIPSLSSDCSGRVRPKRKRPSQASKALTQPVFDLIFLSLLIFILSSLSPPPYPLDVDGTLSLGLILWCFWSCLCWWVWFFGIWYAALHFQRTGSLLNQFLSLDLCFLDRNRKGDYQCRVNTI